MHIFGISSLSRHEKCYRMLVRLFWLFQCSRIPQCIILNLNLSSVLTLNGIFSRSWTKSFLVLFTFDFGINWMMHCIFEFVWTDFNTNIGTFHKMDLMIVFKDIQIILRLFLVIAMYTVQPVQASSINHSTSQVASWLGRKPT